MSEWQSMDSAPKDGRFILAISYPAHHAPIMVVARWKKVYDGYGWQEYTGNVVNPSHWMPLPDFPPEVLEMHMLTTVQDAVMKAAGSLEWAGPPKVELKDGSILITIKSKELGAWSPEEEEEPEEEEPKETNIVNRVLHSVQTPSDCRYTPGRVGKFPASCPLIEKDPGKWSCERCTYHKEPQ